MTTKIVPADPADQAALAAVFALAQETHAADRPDEPVPLWEPFRARLQRPAPEHAVELAAAWLDGRPVGMALLALPVVDNRHLAQFDLEVHPEHRRRGVGRALLAWVRGRARQEQRRTLLTGARRQVPGGPPRSDAGVRFLTTLGFSPAVDARMRRIDLTAVDPAAEQRLLAECQPHAADYQSVTWTGHTPEPLAPGVAYLVNRLNTDAPTGDLEIGQTTLDPARLYADEQAALDRGTHLVGAVARHRTTGEVAAFTRVDARPPGDHGEIWLTIVDPRHRGHRLGTIVKVEIHRRVRQEFPRLRYVETGNADENAHMVAINDRLGYVAYQAATMYQHQLDP